MAARAAARPAPKRAATRAGLDRLWAPWRMEYIGRAEKETGCLFCRVGKTGGARVDARDLVLARTANALLSSWNCAA